VPVTPMPTPVTALSNIRTSSRSRAVARAAEVVLPITAMPVTITAAVPKGRKPRIEAIVTTTMITAEAAAPSTA
jgi:hypothetical protein